VAAGTLLIREAGGRVSQVDGAAARLDSASILATNGRIHEEVSAVLVEG
jgi:myo-inositol-1(or 4)-monophosphatase